MDNPPRIILLRHGKTDFDLRWLKPVHGHKHALESYASSRITTAPPDELAGWNEQIGACVTSELVRSIDSATRLGFTQSLASELFNESELPCPDRLLIPLPWSAFLVCYRVLWLIGYRKNCAGMKRDRQRAKAASRYLTDLATGHSSVLLVGHGVMNRMICSELRKSGWTIRRNSGTGYWSSQTLSR